MIEEVSNKHKTMVWKFNKDGKLCLGCKDHKLALKYYCNECDKVTCIDCCLAYHSWHEFRTLDFAAFTIREHLKPRNKEAITWTTDAYKRNAHDQNE